MGKLTCACLNVKIHTKSDDIKSCDVAQLGINPPAHEFFSKLLAEVVLALEGVATEHKSLLCAEKLCEAWVVYRCINCKVWTHANQTNSNRILVNTSLASSPSEIERLEKSSDFSPLYNVVLQAQNDNHPIKTLSVQSGIYESLQETLTTVQQHLNKFIREEESAMEERIRLFEEKERETFAILESKARRDKNTMIGLILSSEEKEKLANTPDSNRDGDANPSIVKAPYPAKTALSFGAVQTPSPTSSPAVLSPVKPRSALSSMLHAAPTRGGAKAPTKGKRLEEDFDFDPTFDDSNDQRSFYVSDDDETEDTDDSEPDTRIGSSGGRPSRSLYSSSVPITVPMWGTAVTATSMAKASVSNRKSFDEEDEDNLPEHPDDMAASMKALARSMHSDGTEMFGDLPRSRFKTDFGKF